MSELPKGWANASIRDAVSDFETVDPKKTPEKPFRYVDIGAIDNSVQQITAPKEFLGVEAPSRARRVIQTGDVLFSTVRTYLRNVAQVSEELDGELTSTGISVLRANEASDPGYLFRWVCSSAFIDEISQSQDGTLYPAVKDEDVLGGPIPLPPLPEQRRIVRKLDTLSARTTTARTHLTAIDKLVEKYKRLVIGELCLGGVASQFEDQKELPELPLAWEWSRAEELCHWITKGTTPSKGELFSGSGEVPFIKVYNLTFSDQLDFSVEPTFISSDTHKIALKRSKLFPGDVLINIVGPPLGKTAIVPDDFSEWNMNQAIAVFRPKERLYNRFLLYWLSSEWFLSWALSRSKATAGQRNLTLQICRDTPVPLPSFDEQCEIVRRIETAFAKIDRLAAEAEKALKLTDRLDQRILAKAFAGELVPQDPTDEPATELLARIREARCNAPKPKRGRKKVAT